MAKRPFCPTTSAGYSTKSSPLSVHRVARIGSASFSAGVWVVPCGVLAQADSRIAVIAVAKILFTDDLPGPTIFPLLPSPYRSTLPSRPPAVQPSGGGQPDSRAVNPAVPEFRFRLPDRPAV